MHSGYVLCRASINCRIIQTVGWWVVNRRRMKRMEYMDIMYIGLRKERIGIHHSRLHCPMEGTRDGWERANMNSQVDKNKEGSQQVGVEQNKQDDGCGTLRLSPGDGKPILFLCLERSRISIAMQSD